MATMVIPAEEATAQLRVILLSCAGWAVAYALAARCLTPPAAAPTLPAQREWASRVVSVVHAVYTGASAVVGLGSGVRTSWPTSHWHP